MTEDSGGAHLYACQSTGEKLNTAFSKLLHTAAERCLQGRLVGQVRGEADNEAKHRDKQVFAEGSSCCFVNLVRVLRCEDNSIANWFILFMYLFIYAYD